MQTQAEYAKSTPDYGYWGDNGHCLLVYAIHRDSSVLERSNFEALKRMIPSDDIVIETDSHWLVGHVERLMVEPDSEAIPELEKALEDLKDYPLVDEELYSEMEFNEACDTAEQALYELGIPQAERKDAASFVVSWGCDAGGKDDYAYCGVENYWPSKQAQFWGYVAYRRFKRNHPEN